MSWWDEEYYWESSQGRWLFEECRPRNYLQFWLYRELLSQGSLFSKSHISYPWGKELGKEYNNWKWQDSTLNCQKSNKILEKDLQTGRLTSIIFKKTAFEIICGPKELEFMLQKLFWGHIIISILFMCRITMKIEEASPLLDHPVTKNLISTSTGPSDIPDI